MTTTTAQTITLRYLHVSRELSLTTAFSSPELRDRIAGRAMERLGIAVPEGTRPIEAWLSAMCIANGLPDVRPVPPALLDAIIIDRAAWDFFYALI